MNNQKKLKMAIIAGAAAALKYKDEHPSSSRDEIIRYINRESMKILEKLDTEY